MTSVYNLSIAAKATLNLHSLNNEGSEGNQTQTRMTTIADQEGRLHTVNSISGDMLKHIQARHLYTISRSQDLPLCAACKLFDPNRMSADPAFQAWLNAEKPTPSKIIDRLLTCTLDDIEGNLITQGNNSVPRKSVVEFGWAVGLPEAVVTEQFFHVKYDPNRGEIPTGKDDRSGNLGQAIFHRPASSGQYALICTIEAGRIGYNDVSQRYVLDAEERSARLRALLGSLLYTFVQPAGAMRNTQNPHIVDVTGVITYSTAPAPAPLLSPLNGRFAEQTHLVAASLNRLHPGNIVVQEFKDLAQLADIVSTLAGAATAYQA
jgi:CRISPR-associated protein Cst2